MEYKNFTGGVEPGGLRSKQDIKVLICYILSNIESMRKQDIISALQEKGIANYFLAGDAFSELVSGGNIGIAIGTANEYEVKKSGKMISDQLYSSIPRSIREKAVEAARNTIIRVKNEEENKVKIERNDLGFNVTCSISGGEFDLLRFTLYVPDIDQANKVKENFRSDPESVYRVFLSVLTRKKDIDKDLKMRISNLME